MSWSRLLARLRGLFERSRRDLELDDEIRFHIEMQIKDNRNAGMTPTDAKYEALRSFGAIEAMKETHREQQTFVRLETVGQDIRFALRTLRRSPSFTITSVTLLALAIGASTTMLSVLNAVLLRPLAYRAPEQLTMLWSESPSQNVREGRSSYWAVEQWRGHSKSFDDLAVLDPVSVTLASDRDVKQVSAVRVSPNFFPLLGVRTVHGRLFTTEEAEQRQRVVVISHQFWQSHFAGSHDAIGASIEIDGSTSQIIGILPLDFGSEPFSADVWQPHTMFPDWETRRAVRGPESWLVAGRLKPGVTSLQAQVEMNAIAHLVNAGNREITVVPLSKQLTDSKSWLALWTLTGAVLCVLLLVAINVAGLALARSAAREKEMAIRAAMGAGRGRIIRQLLVEGLTVALLAGCGGLLTGWVFLHWILAIKPVSLPRLNEASLDPHVLGWAILLCVVTGVLIAIAPAMTLGRRTGLQRGRGISGGAGAHGLRSALVVTEFSLAVVLLAGAGLLLRSLWSLTNVDPGFKPERVLSLQLSCPSSTAARQVDFLHHVLEQVESLPGVESAGMIGDLFIGGSPEQVLTIEGDAHTQRLRYRVDEVSTRFFQTVGTPLLKGRFFSSADGSGAPRVVLINDALARRMWPARDPIGMKLKIGEADDGRPWATVVGVIGDMRRQGLESEAIAQIFAPLAQSPSRLVTLLVRTHGQDAAQMFAAVQHAVHRVDKHVPLYGMITLEQRLARGLTPRRFQTALLSAFAIAALLIAAIGIYGLVQYSVTARTHEIGIRIAIGAQQSNVFRMIIGEGLKLSAIGLALGLAGALGLGRAAASLLFGVSASDPLTFFAISMLLTLVGAVACLIPARRAMKIEPVAALRQE